MLAVVFTFLLCLSFPQSFESCSCMEFQSEKDGYCATSWSESQIDINPALCYVVCTYKTRFSVSKVKVVSKETDGLGLMMSYRLEHLKVIKVFWQLMKQKSNHYILGTRKHDFTGDNEHCNARKCLWSD